MLKKLVNITVIALTGLVLMAQTTDLGSTNYIGSHAWKTQTKSLSLLAPVTGDSGQISFQLPRDSSISRVSCATIGAATDATINLNKRAEATPGTSGTNALSAGLVCDTDSQTSCSAGCTVDTINSAAVTARSLVTLVITAVTGTPTALQVHVEYVEN